MAAKTVTCNVCKGTGQKPEHGQRTGICLWCGGNGKHLDVPYPMFCMDTDACAGRGSCPRSYSCCE